MAITEAWAALSDTVSEAGHPGVLASGGGGVIASSLAPSATQTLTPVNEVPVISTSRAGSSPHGPELVLYIEDGCSSCDSATGIAERARDEFPHVVVTIVDLSVSSEHQPRAVYAVPTFLLDGEVVSLGTPSWEQLAPLLHAALEGAGTT
ncbi:MAG: thioredoxin family protein [Dehalococcoidia bacterium]|nr:thioredoxin family protein [Dehalococcoidia bacterium]